MSEHERLRTNLRTLVDTFAAATGRGPSMICTDAIGSPSFYRRNLKGSDPFVVTTYDRFAEWLSANWPATAGYPWPPEISRPIPPFSAK